jgi:hypothetical protein
MENTTTADWDDIFQIAAENNCQVWKAPDGSVAIASYDGMDAYAERTGDDDWTEIKHEDHYYK